MSCQHCGDSNSGLNAENHLSSLCRASPYVLAFRKNQRQDVRFQLFRLEAKHF